MNSVTSSDIESFVVEHTGVEAARLRRDSRLLQDLGLEGDDADEFFTAFADRFQVDLSGFEFGRHFGLEAAWQLQPLFWLLFDRKRLARVPVTLDDLLASAREQRWVAPDRAPLRAGPSDALWIGGTGVVQLFVLVVAAAAAAGWLLPGG